MKPEEQKTVDLRDVLQVTLKRKWLIIVPFVLVLSGATAGSYLLTPEYQSSSILSYGNSPTLIKPLSGLVSAQADRRMSSEDRRRFLAAMRNEITSSRVLFRLITELELDQNPVYEEKAQRLRASSPALDLQTVKRSLIIQELREAITVEYAGKDQLLISVFNPDAFMAQIMTQSLTRIFIEERILQDLGAVREAQQLTDDQLTKFEAQLGKLIDQKTLAEEEYLRLQIDENIISEDNRHTIRKAIDEVSGEVSGLTREQTTLLADLNTTKALRIRHDSHLRSLQAQLSEDSRSLVDLMGKYVWSERIVLNGTIALNRKLLEFENALEEIVAKRFESEGAATVRNVKRHFVIQERLSFLRSHKELLQKSFNRVQLLATRIPASKANLDQLDREVEAARQNLDLFQQQETSNQLRQDIIHSASSRYQVIEPAVVPLEASRPNRPKISVMGAILGIILGAAAALTAELLDSSFRKVEDVEDELGLPVLAAIPKIDAIKV